MLKGKKIILGITGSIAAYKACYIIRGLIRQGAEVQVVITPAGPANRSSVNSLPNVTERGTATLTSDCGQMRC